MENNVVKSKEILIKEDYIPWYSGSIKMSKIVHDDGEIVYTVDLYNHFTKDSKCGFDLNLKVYFDNKESAKSFYKNWKEGLIDDVKKAIRTYYGDNDKAKEWVRKHYYDTITE